MTGEIKLNSLNILHISDAHIQLDAKEEVSEIVVKMINDALKVQKEQDIKIDLVCFTGDLIQRGDKALDDEKQLEIAEEILVNPLLNSLGLENNKFIIIPGNHEVDVKKIVKATEKGLLVDSLEEINDNVSDMNESYLARLDYFYQWIDNYYDDIIREKIGYAFLREINGKKIGIACIDSAWRSSGKGGCEKGIMYVGQKQINDLYKHIKDADIKICLMHHPTDWLSDYESTIIERELTKFDIVLRGHVHENDHKEVCRQSMKTIYSTAGKIYPLDYAFGRAVDGYNGYLICEKGMGFISIFCTNERKENAIFGYDVLRNKGTFLSLHQIEILKCKIGKEQDSELHFNKGVAFDDIHDVVERNKDNLKDKGIIAIKGTKIFYDVYADMVSMSIKMIINENEYVIDEIVGVLFEDFSCKFTIHEMQLDEKIQKVSLQTDIELIINIAGIEYREKGIIFKIDKSNKQYTLKLMSYPMYMLGHMVINNLVFQNIRNPFVIIKYMLSLEIKEIL